MTRLSPEDIKHISLNYLSFYDLEFKRKTGKCLLEFMEHIAGKKINPNNLKIAVVPITAGKGIIEGFSEAVCSIVRYLGCQAFVTLSTDVAGFFESFRKEVDIIFAADDFIFSAFNLNTKKAIDNSFATGYGYAATLELAAKGIHERDILVIGVGRVGLSAVEYLLQKKAKITVFDKNMERIKLVLEKYPQIEVARSIDDVLPKIKLILLAAPAIGLLKSHHVDGDTIISCPALPLPLDESVLLKIRKNLIHDPLQLGVISMLALIS